VAVAVGVMLAGGPAVYAGQNVGQDTPIDAFMDWSATFGKKGAEKDAIIAQRKAERAAKRAQRAAEKQAKKAGKELDKAGKKVKKGLGGSN
jgi:hypothetical protein